MNDDKTEIIPLGAAFDFISRTYHVIDGIVVAEPSDAVVTKLTDSLAELILNRSGSQKTLIERLNKTLTGWATYHKVSDAGNTFKQIDITVQALLLQLCVKISPNMPQKKLIERYFYCDHRASIITLCPYKPNVRVLKSQTLC